MFMGRPVVVDMGFSTRVKAGYKWVRIACILVRLAASMLAGAGLALGFLVVRSLVEDRAAGIQSKQSAVAQPQ